jgi:hypothetical protein
MDVVPVSFTIPPCPHKPAADGDRVADARGEAEVPYVTAIKRARSRHQEPAFANVMNRSVDPTLNREQSPDAVVNVNPSHPTPVDMSALH